MAIYRNANTDSVIFSEDVINGLPEGYVEISLDELNEKTPSQLLAEAKAQKEESLENITVTVNNKVFDGDETARADMSSALTLAQLTNQVSTQWKLANNEWAEVTIAELTEALHLALLEKGRIIGGEF